LTPQSFGRMRTESEKDLKGTMMLAKEDEV
jgi:hypothetical protein